MPYRYVAAALGQISQSSLAAIFRQLQEHSMSQYKTAPHLTDEGVCFAVTVDSLDRECLIRKEALQQLSMLRGKNAEEADAMDTFHAFETKIIGVARRLVAAGVQGTPLVLTHNTFFRPPQRMLS